MSDFLDRFFGKIADIIDRKIKNEKLKGLLKKVFGKEIILYLVFGVLTTLVNFISYALLKKGLDAVALTQPKTNVHIANTAAWIISVLFAFFTNKSFVFESKSYESKTFIRELLSFTGARILSFGVEEGGLFVLNTLLGFNDLVVKIIVAVIVVILNYVFSKIWVFRKKK